MTVLTLTKLTDARKAELTAAVDVERLRRQGVGFVFVGKTFQARDADLIKMNGATTAASNAINSDESAKTDTRWADGQNLFQWIAADNTFVTMDAQTVVLFGMTAMAFLTRLSLQARAIKDQILAGSPPTNLADDALW